MVYFLRDQHNNAEKFIPHFKINFAKLKITDTIRHEL